MRKITLSKLLFILFLITNFSIPITYAYCEVVDHLMQGDIIGSIKCEIDTDESYTVAYCEGTQTKKRAILRPFGDTVMSYLVTQEPLEPIEVYIVQNNKAKLCGTLNEEVCIDNDKLDYNTKGQTKGYWRGELSIFEDECLANTLTEYYCVGDWLQSKEIECEYACELGKCIAPPQPEIIQQDSPEIEQFTVINSCIKKGNTTIVQRDKQTISYQNKCENDSWYMYSCDGVELTKTQIPCEFGCLQSACAQKQLPSTLTQTDRPKHENAFRSMRSSITHIITWIVEDIKKDLAFLERWF